MTKTKRGKEFEAQEPKLTREEALDAFSVGRSAISLSGFPCVEEGTIEFLAVKLALGDGTSPVVLLDRMSAAALKTLIEVCDKVEWNAHRMNPDGVVH